MDVLFVLVPLSVLWVLGVLVALYWTLHNGQFDNLEHEGERILDDPASNPALPETTWVPESMPPNLSKLHKETSA